MTEIVQFGPMGRIAYLRRVGRARRMTLRISRLDRRITLSLPPGVALAEARAFLDTQIEWVEKALADTPEPSPVTIGSVLPVEGIDRRIEQISGRRVALTDTALLVPEKDLGRKLQAFLKFRARERLVAASDGYAARIDRHVSAVTLRDTRSRWGSCTSQGRLMYSWRLIMAPPNVLDYVAAHEVAHLVHLDHSQAFWSLVDDLFGDHRKERAWLREHGGALHRFRFTD